MSDKLPAGPILILDTETGGLNPDRNPLMSIGLVHATEAGIGDQLSLRFKPPEDTWLEVPIPADQLKGKKDKTIAYWLNLTTGAQQPVKEEKPTRLITAIAAEVNGFVGASETTPGWDMTRIPQWGGGAYATAVARISDWLRVHQAGAVVGHNCTFDFKFIDTWLPELLNALPNEWACTQRVYKAAYLNGATKGSSVGAICKVAGYEPTGVLHTELGDCVATYHIWKWLRAQGH